MKTFSPITASPLIYIRSSARKSLWILTQHFAALCCDVSSQIRRQQMEVAHYAVISQDRCEEFAHLGIRIKPSGSDGLSNCYRSETTLHLWLQQHQEGTLGTLEGFILFCSHDLTSQSWMETPALPWFANANLWCSLLQGSLEPSSGLIN